MPLPDSELERICREKFGDPLTPEKRARIGANAEMCAEANRQVIEVLDFWSEPDGHGHLLRGNRP